MASIVHVDMQVGADPVAEFGGQALRFKLCLRLRVATDSRAVLKGVLRDHLGIDTATLDRRVFPDAAGVKPLDGLVRT